MRRRWWLLLAGPLLVGVWVLLILLARTETASPTPEPIVPTRTLIKEATTPTPVVVARTSEATIATPVVVETSTQPATMVLPAATELPLVTLPGSIDAGTLWQGRPRWGVGVATGPISRYDVEPLRLGWYLDWGVRSAPPRPGGVAYIQMIRLNGGEVLSSTEDLFTIAQANPSSLWLVGNEPDVKWQDNLEPAAYARLYHEAYTAIKTADPTAQVASGGVSQPTPLRLRYLEAVLKAYQEQFGAQMPVDVWNVHNFILREERGAWGVDIPPGMPDDRGMLYEIDDSGNLEIFRQQIVDFRRWMAQHGYQDRPLIVSEYGILMPADYGFPPERVVAFLTGTFDFFLTAADPALGYPADNYRLVQLWCWYSLDASADHYPTGNLFNPQTGEMTAVGEGWKTYLYSASE